MNEFWTLIFLFISNLVLNLLNSFRVLTSTGDSPHKSGVTQVYLPPADSPPNMHNGLLITKENHKVV